ncbi:bleomycin resistance protein [Chryseobacterium sp. A301]
MLTEVHPKLPMRDREITYQYYVKELGFQPVGEAEYPDYLMLKKDQVELHFFLFEALDPLQNYAQIYLRVSDIDSLYKSFLDRNIAIHPSGSLQTKPWGVKEFSLLDPDHTLLTFGQKV